MTAKEMAHWEGWLRKGQRRFQLSYTLALFVALGLLPSLLDAALGRELRWLDQLQVSAVVSFASYFVTGWVWRSRIAEYERQLAASCASRT